MNLLFLCGLILSTGQRSLMLNHVSFLVKLICSISLVIRNLPNNHKPSASIAHILTFTCRIIFPNCALFPTVFPSPTRRIAMVWRHAGVQPELAALVIVGHMQGLDMMLSHNGVRPEAIAVIVMRTQRTCKVVL